MSENATTPPPPPAPPASPPAEKPKRKNAPTIPPEFHDQIWELHQQGYLSPAIAAILVAAGCACTRYSVRRTVKRLARARLTPENGFSLRQEIIEQGRVAVVRLRELEDEHDELLERMKKARKKGDEEGHCRLTREARRLESAMSSYERQLNRAARAAEEVAAQVKAEEPGNALRMESECLLRSHQQNLGLTDEDLANPRPDPRIAERRKNLAVLEQRLRISLHYCNLRDTAAAGKQPPTPAPARVPEAAPAPAPAAPAPSADSTLALDLDELYRPRPTFTLPEHGAVLETKPELYGGKGIPGSKVLVTVDERNFKDIPVDEDGDWMLDGAQVQNLAPGKHFVVVSEMLSGERLGIPSLIKFTLRSLFLVLLPLGTVFLPLSARANIISLQANDAIYSPCQRSAGLLGSAPRAPLGAAADPDQANQRIVAPCGLVRPPFAFLRDRSVDVFPASTPPNRQGHEHQEAFVAGPCGPTETAARRARDVMSGSPR